MYLRDIADALAELEEYTNGKTKDDYLTDRQLRRAVERVFEIIGEAMSKMIHRFPESRTRIDNARPIANFRNVIVHEYRTIHDALVWDIVTRSAPVLKTQIDAWAAELDHE
jgi:uncharacterized protein with HEPN domain